MDSNVSGLGLDLNLFELGLESISTSPGLGLDKGGLDYSPARHYIILYYYIISTTIGFKFI